MVYRSYPRRLGKTTHLQMSLQKHHFLISYFSRLFNRAISRIVVRYSTNFAKP